MAGVRLVTVSDADGDIRLDRWFKRYYPGIAHGRLEKLLRTGQIRVDGGRAKASDRLASGMNVRLPPLDDEVTEPHVKTAGGGKPYRMTDKDGEMLRGMVLYRDAEVIAINKPAGLAVQGGTNTTKHVDGMLDALTYDAEERPRLVHRLDKDTSGVLLLARTARAAHWLGQAFRDKTARKIYWAAVVGVPKPWKGRIDLAIGKSSEDASRGDGKPGYEKVVADEDEGKDATTYYSVVENAAQRAAWVALLPMTGRTHQLRVHCEALGTPILGDGKYGGPAARMPGIEHNRMLHLHARSISVTGPDGRIIEVKAPLPEHMAETWAFLGFSNAPDGDPFAELKL
jgi:23S rRNA pseudouridine955/2504/2580 synthase